MEISILVQTYNHERYIRQAMDSILTQRIEVPYEIIIVDDASTDDTPQILLEYKKQNPNIIRLYLKRKNSYHPTRNMYFLLSKAKGKYFAIIEGDDYWTDGHKIQKQYEFLENNKEYSACMTALEVVDGYGNKLQNMNLYDKKKDSIYSFEDFRDLKMPGMTVSLFSRNYFTEDDYSILYRACKNMGDITLYMLCVIRGNIYQMEEKMAAYRYVKKDGELNYNSIQKENLYKEYDIVRYWINLENYIRDNYEKGFYFLGMQITFMTILERYPLIAISELIKIFPRDFRKKYWRIVIAKKFLMTSRYGIENRSKSQILEKHCNYKKFSNNKKNLILFGTGEVAKEYVDKYGWKGNIIFCVDNDESKWERSWKGYLVKKPEEIIKYRNKSCVLITSFNYEKEIAEQLEGMGIENYFCWCYMLQKNKRNILAKRIIEHEERRNKNERY